MKAKMKRFRLLGGIALLCMAASNSPSAEPGGDEKAADIPAPVLAAAQSILEIRSAGANCSGFMLDDRRIGTASHCVSSSSVETANILMGINEAAYSPKIVKQNRFLDLAVLEVLQKSGDVRKWKPLRLPNTLLMLSKGKRLFTVGLRTGIHEVRVTRSVPGIPFFETRSIGDEKICRPGDSGGVFLDEEGRLAGIITGRNAMGRLEECYGIRADFLTRLEKGGGGGANYLSQTDAFDVYLLYAHHLGGGYDSQRALRFLKFALSLDNSNTGLNADFCALYVYTHDYRKAIPFCQKASELDPANSWFFYMLANSYLEEGKDEKALEYSKKASALLPDDGHAAMLTAAILEGLNRLDEAQKVYQDILPKVALGSPHLAPAYHASFLISYIKRDYLNCLKILVAAHNDGVQIDVPADYYEKMFAMVRGSNVKSSKINRKSKGPAPYVH
ncbi:MAG: hypothetical protein A2270_11300 [Elusimicrobia bacterium RIFOXYA12_FULL_51_18]|nr:MAG: hypothetical protein A2270_11300 [Elusimicrobia bacterium RIFOXYA12_FULL_51_18]OGS30326.1 MAG: hypothetical protein A2218_01530 [Elusimicrobia bacterium RIFOXYA2_FULL_53_38]